MAATAAGALLPTGAVPTGGMSTGGMSTGAIGAMAALIGVLATGTRPTGTRPTAVVITGPVMTDIRGTGMPRPRAGVPPAPAAGGRSATRLIRTASQRPLARPVRPGGPSLP